MLRRPVELAAETGQVESRQNHSYGNATYQELVDHRLQEQQSRPSLQLVHGCLREGRGVTGPRLGFLRGFSAGKAFNQQIDLTGVVRFVLADVKPFAVIVGWTPGPRLIHGHEPRIVALAETFQSFVASFAQGRQVQAKMERAHSEAAKAEAPKNG